MLRKIYSVNKMKWDKKAASINGIEIKARELIFCITILAVMIFVGLLINGAMEQSKIDKDDQYLSALKVTDKEMFEYGIDTNVGDAFAYSTLEAVDTVTYPEIGDKYMYIEKVEQHYTMHTRTVCSGSGKNRTCRTEIYWTWDTVSRESKHSKKIKFYDHVFPYNKIDMPESRYLKTIHESGTIRYKYYILKTKYKGTIFTSFKNNTIEDNSKFYKNKKINDAVESLTSEDTSLVVFRIIWTILTIGSVIGFIAADNKWLD